MTIEQKAKRYDEALGRAKGLYAKGAPDSLYLEEIFPELKESEDERIRKNLIELFHDTVSNDEIFSDYGLDKTEVLAWLEKQGEQKPINVTNEELVRAKKDAYNDALDKIEYHSGTPTFEDGWSAAIWYLKKRDILKSQSTWKPNEEQMKSLSLATQCVYAEEDIKNLESLYEQLKKL